MPKNNRGGLLKKEEENCIEGKRKNKMQDEEKNRQSRQQ